MTRSIATLVAIAAFLTACGGDDPNDAGESASVPTTAQEAAEALQEAIPQITKLEALTENNDPNDLIGRPNGYSAGTVVFDSRVECGAADFGAACGATVEEWPSEEGAADRADYLKKVRKAAPILGSEYDYVSGKLLLRVSGKLKPSEAAVYEASFYGKPLPANSATDSASSSTAAVEPQPFNVSGLLGGNAKPTFPEGRPGEVPVVAVGRLDREQVGGATLPIAFRNNTSEAVSHVDLSASVRSRGSLVATGNSQGTSPAQVAAGEVGLAYIYFEEALPAGPLEYEFAAETVAADTSPYNTAPMKVTEANRAGGGVAGAAINDTGASATGPYAVHVYCFAGDKLKGVATSYADKDATVAAGDTITFSVDLYGQACRSFAVGVGGYFE